MQLYFCSHPWAPSWLSAASFLQDDVDRAARFAQYHVLVCQSQPNTLCCSNVSALLVERIWDHRYELDLPCMQTDDLQQQTQIWKKALMIYPWGWSRIANLNLLQQLVCFLCGINSGAEEQRRAPGPSCSHPGTVSPRYYYTSRAWYLPECKWNL